MGYPASDTLHKDSAASLFLLSVGLLSRVLQEQRERDSVPERHDMRPARTSQQRRLAYGVFHVAALSFPHQFDVPGV